MFLVQKIGTRNCMQLLIHLHITDWRFHAFQVHGANASYHQTDYRTVCDNTKADIHNWHAPCALL